MAKKPKPAKGQKKLRTPDLIYLGDVTHMTLLNWRRGSARKTRPLPAEIDEEGHVWFGVRDTKKWFRENGLTLKMDPMLYLRGGPVRKRPGPKPVTKVPGEKKPAVKKARTKQLVEANKGIVKPAAVKPTKHLVEAHKASVKAATVKRSRAAKKPVEPVVKDPGEPSQAAPANEAPKARGAR